MKLFLKSVFLTITATLLFIGLGEKNIILFLISIPLMLVAMKILKDQIDIETE